MLCHLQCSREQRNMQGMRGWLGLPLAPHLTGKQGISKPVWKSPCQPAASSLVQAWTGLYYTKWPMLLPRGVQLNKHIHDGICASYAEQIIQQINVMHGLPS